MADVCLSSGEDRGEETMDQNKDLERMIEDVENISVQLTWMAYDMVVQRTSPDLTHSLRRLEEEYIHCKAIISGFPGDLDGQNQGHEPGMGQGLGLEMQECPAGSGVPQSPPH